MVTVVQAKPQLKPLGPNIADTGSEWYHFRSAAFDSADGQRHYRVWVGIPKAAAPAAGYPVLYMLDGNAAMARLDNKLLQRLNAAHPPVLVAIGYQTPLPFDISSRAWDYTPDPGSASASRIHGYKGGYSKPFRRLLMSQIVPWSEKQAAVDIQQRSLWGHSFGGLFVLDTLYHAPEAFRHYYAASPSLGWGGGMMLSQAKTLSGSKFNSRTLRLMEGNGNSDRPGLRGDDGQDRNARLAQILSGKGVKASYKLYPGLSHGAMFGASLIDTLLNVSGVESR
ncbi:alpha/beta hydrolase [Erwinia sp. CPCC 100877]|nr:alpha/beta hydrolase [Erwinia sp. CPCC 100877]